ETVTREDVGDRRADERVDSPAHECLRGVLARGATAEVGVDDHHRRISKALRVHRMVFLFVVFGKPLVEEGEFAESVEGDRLQESSGNDLVGVDVVPSDRDTCAGDVFDGLDVVARAHRTATSGSSRTSVTSPVTAAAATITGL